MAASKQSAKQKSVRQPAPKVPAYYKGGWCFEAAKLTPQGELPPDATMVDEAYFIYHDGEWGIPVHDDRVMFEHLMLECLQCGLSWDYILKHRAVLRQAFFDFDMDRVARMGKRDISRALKLEGMLKSPRKIAAVINNAKVSQQLREEFGSFCGYFWNWTEGKTIFYMGHQNGKIPVTNELATKIAKDLKLRGFTYVGPTNVYAHLQACGIVCDHHKDCPQYNYVQKTHPYMHKRCRGES